MYQKSEFEIEIRDSVIEEENNKAVIYVRNPGSDKPLYKLSIHLHGNDLPYIDSVKYELHPTFKNRFKVVKRTLNNPNCTLVIWTWGIFKVNAVVTTKDGSKFNISHQLTYGDELTNGVYDVVSERAI